MPPTSAPFKDHFSAQSADYSRYRPGYPAELIAYVASVAPDRRLAVDCATGNGQAALALAAHFETVIAVDASRSQVERAPPHPRVRYECASAEDLPLPDACASLVVAAQAAHWFEFERFYAECRRVLAPGGAFAAWTYDRLRVNEPVDAAIDDFYARTVGPYWPPERRYVEEGYRTLPFPWREEPAPSFVMRTEWNLAQVMGYLASWSAVQRYKDAHGGEDPLPALRARLKLLWPVDGGARLVAWPVSLRVGRA
jgi:SAM-dependent methyltransferase